MRRLFAAGLLALVLAGCSGSTATEAPTAAPTAPALPPTSAPTAPPTSAVITPAPSQFFKAGDWPPEWQFWICSARAQMLREDAKAGGRAGEDAATQAITDLKKTTINWEPGADFRALLGKSAFILLDAAPRKGNAMADVPPAINQFERAYDDLRAATGFECP